MRMARMKIKKLLKMIRRAEPINRNLWTPSHWLIELLLRKVFPRQSCMLIVTRVKMRAFPITKLAAIIQFILVKLWMIDILSCKSLVGAISLPSGSPEIVSMILMLLLKFKKVLHIIKKRPLMKLRFLMLWLATLMIKNGSRAFSSTKKTMLSFRSVATVSKIAILSSCSIHLCIRAPMVSILLWCLKYWELIF